MNHAGGCFINGTDPIHIGRDRSVTEYNREDRACDWVTFACVLIDAALYREIELNVNFWYSYEDVDFCLRAQESGVRPMVAHDALVRHDEYGTPEGRNDLANLKVFRELWSAARSQAAMKKRR